MKSIFYSVCVFIFASAAAVFAAAGGSNTASVQIQIDCAKPTVELSPDLYGLFFEDINYGADGGLYAELIQNRSFEYFNIEPRDHLREKTAGDMNPMYAWEVIERGGGQCRTTVSRWTPLNRANENYLTIYIDKPGDGVGVVNLGYDGIRIEQGETYDVSLYALLRDGDKDESLMVSLEGADGTVYGSFQTGSLSPSWQKYSGTITASQSTGKARLTVVTKAKKGKLLLDMVSLFPQKTFKGRKNGLRPDLAQALADLHPKFLRFPGGCTVHGYGLAQAYRWKDSVGDVAKRRANHTTWGYHESLGLGYYEYFQLCEDIGAAPLPVLPVGVSCGFNFYEYADMDELDDWIQDVLDLIEFANGPANSKWGGLRARMGHPEPFGLKYICLGNEEHDTPQVRERFPLFVAAVKKAHPEIMIIGTSGIGAGIPLYPLMKKLGVHSSDEHYYNDPAWFIKNQNRFDTVDRNGPKRFVGEYASNGNTLFNAIAEAVYLTGIERNGDIVEMAAYAPLLARVDHIDWPKANMIYFDRNGLVKTPNYYVQQMFSCNQGDIYLSNRVLSENTNTTPDIALSATRDNSAKEIILKLVNYGDHDVDADIHLAGVTHFAPQAEVTVLTGKPKAVNTLQNPNVIVPQKTVLKVGEQFEYKIPACSVQVIRIGMKAK
jgi:alpha-L-arabinofuranosidase